MFGRPNAAVLLLLLVVAAALVIPGNAQPTKQLDNPGKGLGKSKTCGYCLPNPCKNSGECSVEEDGSGFNCTCPSPYTGVICDSEKPSLCLPNPCKNSGECSVEDGGSGFHCTCPSPYTGVICDSRVVAGSCGYCLPNPCKNSGECSIEEDGSGFKCACPSPFAGTFCTAVEMEVATSRPIWMFDSNTNEGSLKQTGVIVPGPFNSSLVVVNNYLIILVAGNPDSGFSIRVKGTFLGGDEMLCRLLTYEVFDDFFYYNVGEWKEPGFVVPENEIWINPEQAVDCPDLFFPGDVEGSTIPAPDDKKLWLVGAYDVVCRLKLDDLNLNLLE